MVYIYDLYRCVCMCIYTYILLLSVLYWIHLCIKYSLAISNFLEEISRKGRSEISRKGEVLRPGRGITGWLLMNKGNNDGVV